MFAYEAVLGSVCCRVTDKGYPVQFSVFQCNMLTFGVMLMYLYIVVGSYGALCDFRDSSM